MEEKNMIIKCSAKEHEKIEAISYCQQCNIYMCNKCDNFHNILFQSHVPYNINKNKNDIFIGICTEKGHNNKIEYFCKNHNQLCCDACIIKIKVKGKGDHKDCNICLLEEIKDLKKNKLKENINTLEELLNNIEEKINQFKLSVDKINEEKEELKLKIQKIFTKIRNIINEREDKLLLDVDTKFDKIYFNENRINEVEKLPNKIKISLERGKILEKEWNDENKLCSYINTCIDIENNIKNACDVNDILKKFTNENKDKIDFFPNEEKELNKLLESLISFGKIITNNSFILFDSKIINQNKEYIQNIKKWINNEKKIKTELLYRKTDNGDSCDTFHQLCDNKGATLILIKGKEGFIIGGYTPLSWDNNSGWKKDNDTFLFSLTNNQTFRKNVKDYNNDRSICCSKDGPNFCCLRFIKNNMSKGTFSTNCSYYINLNNIIPNNGPRDFIIEEVEIYKITYI